MDIIHLSVGSDYPDAYCDGTRHDNYRDFSRLVRQVTCPDCLNEIRKDLKIAEQRLREEAKTDTCGHELTTRWDHTARPCIRPKGHSGKHQASRPK